MHLPANTTFTDSHVFQKQNVGLDAPARQQFRYYILILQHIATALIPGEKAGCSRAIVQYMYKAR